MEIDEQIEYYNSIKETLESENLGKWVLIHNKQVIAYYDSFDEAARDSVSKFGNGPYLIRQIGASQVVLPASVMFQL
ncbi:MAG: hypothetical protein ACOYMZ_03460 [Minisyncoccia bacterium]